MTITSQNERDGSEYDPRAAVKWLVDLRERHGISQRVLADRLGVSQSTLSRLESGEDRHLSIAEAAAYVNALGMSCTLKIFDDGMPADVQLRRTVIEVMRLLTRLSRLLERHGANDAVIRELDAFIGGGISPLLLEALDSGGFHGDAAFGVMNLELAPGA